MSKTTEKKSVRKTAHEDSQSALRELFVDQLKDMYWAEKHLVKALSKMKKAATSSELQDAFETHLAQTETHVGRLEKVFGMMDEKAQAKKCDAMEGLVEEGESIIEETEDGSSTRDVGLIIAAQKVEHYEIASYGGLATLAKTMGRDDIKDILGQTLSEEKQTDELLTSLAEGNINIAATAEEA
jgi:ferritin-like metal-binding protein YciE